MEIPKNIKNLLDNEKLCVMATYLGNKSYLSLMNFTYLEAENKIILSTRKSSKKYNNILLNSEVSLLVYSLPDGISATFEGTALTLDDQDAVRCRDLHYAKNNNMKQFIVGQEIGLILFKIQKIIISDSQDQVSYVCETPDAI